MIGCYPRLEDGDIMFQLKLALLYLATHLIFLPFPLPWIVFNQEPCNKAPIFIFLKRLDPVDHKA